MQHISQRSLVAGAIELKGDDDDPVSFVTKAVEDLTKTVDERLTAVEEKADTTKLVERMDKLEAKGNRPSGTPADKDTNETTAVEKKAFGTYLRNGAAAPAEDLKALTVTNDTQGGYLAPAEMSTEFIRDLVEFSPIRSIASVRNIAAPSVKYPKRTSGTNAQWESEEADSQESTIALGQLEVTARKLMTYVDMSNELLADSGGTAQAEVNMALAEDFGVKESTSFVNGDGVLQPEGFMTNTDVAYTANGSATVFASDPLITLMYALPAAYRNRGTWAMNGTTLAAARKLKDGNGNYLWQPAYQAGQPETLLGRPVVEALDMPDIASGTFPIAFGDFNAAYRIIDRLAMSILVNPYLLATKGLTRIHATRRVGGRVIQAAAIRKLKMATS
jgi:HK97 family phage major capsid protein